MATLEAIKIVVRWRVWKCRGKFHFQPRSRNLFSLITSENEACLRLQEMRLASGYRKNGAIVKYIKVEIIVSTLLIQRVQSKRENFKVELLNMNLKKWPLNLLKFEKNCKKIQIFQNSAGPIAGTQLFTIVTLYS